MTQREVYQPPFSLEKQTRYKSIRKLGMGTFGEVRLARDSITGREVAVKHVRLLSKHSRNGVPKAVFREVEALRQLSDCEHIVRLLDVFGEETSVGLVMELMDHDLCDVIQYSQPYIPLAELKCYFWMMIQAVHYCHSKSIIHRDIKPSNFLITSRGLLKLADFGLARVYDASSPGELSHQVCTRHYRPPEVLFASRSYTPAVDIWPLGVIFVELMTLRTLFPGQNDIDQMYKVFQVLGTPNPSLWPEVETLPDYHKVKFAEMDPMPWSLLLPHMQPEDVAFIERFVQCNPAHRITAAAAMKLEYFECAPLPCTHTLLSFQLTRKQKDTAPQRDIKSVDAYLDHLRAMTDTSQPIATYTGGCTYMKHAQA